MASSSLLPILRFNLPPPNPISPPPKYPVPRKAEPLNLGPEEPKSNQVLATPPPDRILRSPTTLKTNNQKLKQLIQSQRLDEAKDLYVKLRSEGIESGIVLESVLIDSFMKSGCVSDAFRVFDGMAERNVITWTSMISGCTQNGHPGIGVSLFIELLESDTAPNDFAFNAALCACAELAALGLGEQLHSLIERSGLGGDCRTGNCLIDFYSRCGSTDKAELVFKRMTERDLVSFTSLISGFCRNNLFEAAIGVFDQMVRQGLEPNDHTITSILTACGPSLGEQIHGYMIKSMIIRSVHSASALVEFYSKYNEFERAKLAFEKLEAKNVVTWSSMISCCLRHEQVEDALRMYCAMICAGVEPNKFTLATTVGACGYWESNNLGQQLHCSIIKLNQGSDNRVSNALLTMYARNGQTEELAKVFERMKDPDVVTWCAAISGYFQNGFNERSTGLLCEMHRIGYTPNEYGFSSALGSCANLALLDQGRQFHCLALKSGCDLDVCTGNALVNMYAKCGCIDDARLAFDVMPTHDVMSWNSLIHGYAHHGHGKKVLKVFDEMLESKGFFPDHSTFVGVLVGCSYVGCVDEGIRYFRIMSDRYGVAPSASHYACMIDMMGRSGRISDALCIIDNMPFEPDILIWKTLLGSCRLHGNLELGKFAAEKVTELSPKDSASYVLLSNLHAMHGRHEDAERVRITMEERGVKKDAGWSWIETRSEVHAFVASDKSHQKAETIYMMLAELFVIMKDEGYSPDIGHQQYNL